MNEELLEELTTFIRAGLSTTVAKNNIGFWCENVTPLIVEIYAKHINNDSVNIYIYAAHVMYFINTVYVGDIEMCVEMVEMFVETQLNDIPYININPM